MGKKLSFDLTPYEDETVVIFNHADWREPVEFMYQCSTKWAVHLIDLKKWLEGGPSTAFPEEIKVSNRWG